MSYYVRATTPPTSSIQSYNPANETINFTIPAPTQLIASPTNITSTSGLRCLNCRDLPLDALTPRHTSKRKSTPAALPGTAHTSAPMPSNPKLHMIDTGHNSGSYAANHLTHRHIIHHWKASHHRWHTDSLPAHHPIQPRQNNQVLSSYPSHVYWRD